MGFCLEYSPAATDGDIAVDGGGMNLKLHCMLLLHYFWKKPLPCNCDACWLSMTMAVVGRALWSVDRWPDEEEVDRSTSSVDGMMAAAAVAMAGTTAAMVEVGIVDCNSFVGGGNY